MNAAVTLFWVRGIPVRARPGAALLFALVYHGLTYGYFPSIAPGLHMASYIGLGVASTLLFFGSIILHELGHAFQALREGWALHGIRLSFIGGLLSTSGAIRPGSELRVAAAGPLVSFLLAATSGALVGVGRELRWPELLNEVVGLLGWANAFLLLFNLLPAFPLDGGRILRVWLWRRRDFGWATTWAARLGQAFGLLAIALGVVYFFSGTFVAGLRYALIGAFLLPAARSEGLLGDAWERWRDIHRSRQPRRLEELAASRELQVGDLTEPGPVPVPPTASVAEFLERVGQSRGYSTFPYPVMEDGRIVGVVSLGLASRVPRDRQESSTVAEIMLSKDSAQVLKPETPLREAFEALQEGSGRAVLLEGARVVAIVTAADVAAGLLEAQESERRGRGRVRS